VIADKGKYNIGPLGDHDRAAFSCGNAPSINTFENRHPKMLSEGLPAFS